MIVKILRTLVRDKSLDYNESEFFKRSSVIHEEPNLLFKLNSIIEWDFVTWPLKPGSEIERDENYLGPEKELKKGDAFSIGESGNLQVIRILGENKIGLEHTETGGFALKRLVDTVISPEIFMTFSHNILPSQVNVEKVDEVPGNFTVEKRINYNQWTLFADRFFPGRESDWSKEDKIKIMAETDFLPWPVILYIDFKTKSLYFEEDSGFNDDDFLSEFMKDIWSWFFNNYRRLKVIEKPKKTEDDMVAEEE